MQVDGRAWRVGDNVDTDVIIPARYLITSDPAQLAPHCLEDLDPGFAAKVRPGDLLVAGRNFGCGSSREHAPIAIKGAGIAAVVAASFARLFYRNALNIGLPIVEAPDAAAETKTGDELELDLSQGTVRNRRTGNRYPVAPYPPFMLELVAAGGLIPYLRARQAAPAPASR